MQRVLLHTSFWLAYVLGRVYLNVTNDITSFELLPEGAMALFYQQTLIQMTFLVVKLPFTYTSLHLLDRYLNRRSSLGWVIGAVTVLLALGAVMMSLLNHKVVLPHLYNMAETEFSVFSTGSLMYHSFSLAFITGMAAAFKLIRWQHNVQLSVANLQKEKTDAELKYLKGQINPHFLFNTLNNIYGLARKGSTATAESVLRLSTLMRFMLFEASNSRILLRNEIELIKDYIELERLRYTDRLSIDFKYETDNENQEIAPLLLIHFVENAFKHGVSETYDTSFIRIEIRLLQHMLNVSIVNSVPATAGTALSANIGMENVSRQLELLYPKHRLIVEQNPTTFNVSLTIPLN